MSTIYRFLNCDVVFGSPSADCSGTGICKIDVSYNPIRLPKKRECRVTVAQVAAGPDGKISLFFFREFLCTQLYRQHLYKGVLEMKEPCPLPKSLSKGLGIKGKSILPGNYAMVGRDGYFRVDLDCA